MGAATAPLPCNKAQMWIEVTRLMPRVISLLASGFQIDCSEAAAGQLSEFGLDGDRTYAGTHLIASISGISVMS
jgi:hypothetical protein